MIKDKNHICTTQDAAAALGISITSVQKLVEQGELQAWKTPGGHRRILRSSVLDFKSKGITERAGECRTRLVMVEDDDMLRYLYAGRFAQWELPLDIVACRSGYEGLIEVGVRKPDILLLDIVMRGIDGYELMETVLARPDYRGVHIAILTGLARAELEARGGIPPGVALFGKPAPFDQLRGFFTACCMQKQRAGG